MYREPILTQIFMLFTLFTYLFLSPNICSHCDAVIQFFWLCSESEFEDIYIMLLGKEGPY